MTTELCCDLLCRSLTSLSGAEEATRNELEACSAEQCASLQAAASDLLQTVDVTGDSVNAFSLHVTDFCDEMQQVQPVQFTLLKTKNET